MTDEQILEQLGQAFAEAMVPVVGPLDPRLAFDEIEGMDSVARVRLMMCVQKMFAIRIPPREGSAVHSVGDLKDLVVEKLGRP